MDKKGQLFEAFYQFTKYMIIIMIIGLALKGCQSMIMRAAPQ